MQKNYSSRPGMNLQLFARGRDYMMRSEKRSSGAAAAHRPQKRRRKRAGFFYLLLTLLLSLILWPVGMLMLWRRKVRWRVTTKLLTSIVTLVLCVVMLTFGLTVQTDNRTVTKVQDSINDFLENAALYTADAYTFIYQKGEELWASASNFGEAASRAGARAVADGLDCAVVMAGEAREWIFDQIDAIRGESSDVTVDPTAETGDVFEPEGTAAASPTPDSTREIPLVVPKDTPDPAEATAIGNGTLSTDGDFTETTDAPSAEPDETDAPVKPTATAKPASTAKPAATTKPDTTAKPDSTAKPTATVKPTATAKPTAEPTAAPTEVPGPTATPVVDPELLPVPAGEAIVYYNSNGVNYHLHSSCVNMSSASPHTLAEAAERGLRRCRNCDTPDISILEEENVVWLDEAQMFHLNAECDDFEGDWSLDTLDNAIENGFMPCATCKAGLYMVAMGRTVPTPSPAPTSTPGPETVTPTVRLKSAAEATVYHSSNGSYYHMASTCKGMTGSAAYTLGECVEGGYKTCRTCSAPDPELLEEICLWQDDEDTCHTTDECPAFSGQWTLVIRDEALEDEAVGCKVCGANEYLRPNTIIALPVE